MHNQENLEFVMLFAFWQNIAQYLARSKCCSIQYKQHLIKITLDICKSQ